ncbi:MAG TPA: squalene/phytoene synthase family protein, partial [Alphaproteobacteria bacterium]|nr:squalene/phytoene synthase family protein [Alphaproteobacteria bacterium]
MFQIKKRFNIRRSATTSETIEHMAHASFDYCYQIVRKNDPDRYWLCLTAPRSKQPILMALCAFNVELSRVGELTKDPLLAQIRLQWWRDW